MSVVYHQNSLLPSYRSGLLCADDSCLIFQHADICEIETRLNKDFANICNWFVDNKLSIHFSEDKIKSILFGNKCKIKSIGTLNITYNKIKNILLLLI